MNVVIYTDGACKGNPGPGGWGAILQYQTQEKLLYGAESLTTNNRMELTAVIKALEALNRRCDVQLYTDSQYVCQAMTLWIHAWKRKGWRNSKKEPVKNADLWLMLDEVAQKHDIVWHWVKGHSGNVLNERVDALANQAIIELL